VRDFSPQPRTTLYREIEKFRGDATEINFSIIERSDHRMHLLSSKNNAKADDFEGAEYDICIYLFLYNVCSTLKNIAVDLTPWWLINTILIIQQDT